MLITKEGNEMNWSILVGPVLGAIIGYVTNKIAVEMLFHPLKPIYIGKFKVPFTPGIIPKGKERLGKAIGGVVGNNLLTPTVIKETLLSDKIQNDIKQQVDMVVYNLSNDSSTVKMKMQSLLGESSVQRMEDQILPGLTDKIYNGLKSMNLGEIVATEVTSAVQEKVQGTMLAMFLKPSTIAPITDEIKIRVDRYLNDHGEEVIGRFIQDEYTELQEKPISSMIQNPDTTELKQVILNQYIALVNHYAETFLSNLNLAKIVEEKVSAMDTKEVEKLVLSIMEKELGAVVNLGAVIGFILGLIEIFI